MRAYILNDRRELQPPNTLGNLFVAGVQVSHGYLDLHEATANSYFRDPFLPESSNERMYDTGDIGFWDIDGKIQCCGRKDRQVKLRGFRINLDGISNMATLRMPTIRHAVAFVKDGAVVLCVEPEDVDADELRTRLKDALPPHAIPRTIYAIAHIPLSLNGKIDVKSLAAMEVLNGTVPTNGVIKTNKLDSIQQTSSNGLSNGASHASGEAHLEKLIIQEWQQILDLDPTQPLSKSDDFVLLGGDSIRQLNLAARLRSVLGLPIKVKDIIRSSTLGDLITLVAQQQEQHGKRNVPNGAPAHNTVDRPLGYKNLSPPEMEWACRYRHSQSQSTFNVPFVARLSPAVDWQRLASAFETVLNRHRVLRSQFTVRKDGSGERVLSEQPINVKRTVHDVNIQEVINRPFKIDSSEALIHTVVSPSTLVLCISHILCDLTSINTLLCEVAATYHGLALPPVVREYFDITWHHTVDHEKQQFWTEYLEGLGFKKPNLASQVNGSNGVNGCDHSNGTKIHKPRSYRGTSRTTSLPDSLYRRLIISSTKNGFTFHQFGMAVAGLVLHFLTGRDDIVLGSPFVNRPSFEDRQVIGLFLEPLPVRISVKHENENDDGPDAREFVQNVRQSSQSALAHSVPWSELMSHLGLPFPSAQPQLFSCCVTFHDDRGTEPPLAIHGVEGQYISAEGAKFSLLFEWQATRASEHEQLTVRLEYDTDWISAEFVEILETLLLECFRMLLEEDESHHGEVKERLGEVLRSEATRIGVGVDEIKETARQYLTVV